MLKIVDLKLKDWKNVQKIYKRAIKILQVWKSYILRKIMWAENLQPKRPKVENNLLSVKVCSVFK